MKLFSITLVLALTSAVLQAQPLPAEGFFKDPAVREATLSPDGQHLAITSAAQPGERRSLYLLDLRPGGTAKRLLNYRDGDVGGLVWAGSDRLLYSVTDYSEGVTRWRGAPGLLAISIDGKQRRILVKREYSPFSDGKPIEQALEYNHQLLRVPQPFKGEVLVGETGTNTMSLFWLDVVTGRTRAHGGKVPAGSVGYLTDSQGELRVAFTRSGKDQAAWWRGAGDADWRKLTEGDLFGMPFTPNSVDDSGQLFVTRREGPGEHQVLVRFDFERMAPATEALVQAPGFDFDGRLLTEPGSGRALGVRLTADTETTVWFDAARKALQAELDARLPGHINSVMRCVRCNEASRVALVYSYSDQDPGRYWLHRGQPGEGQSAWQAVASVRPDIEPRQMATVAFERIRARDGRDLPIWLTLPPNLKPGEPRPAVVLVHGGPWTRGGFWAWQAMQQFLASRGYVVIEPDFRGSTGYGEAHFKAGFKQWGQAMQDDVADALLWAQKQGLASQQACIAGASYGGYSTLMGLVRHPELYRCGIAWVAVADLELYVKGNWFVADDISRLGRKYTIPQMVGDADKDGEMLRANSPLLQAARIKAPLLLAMGELDLRVPLAHGKRLKEAMEAAGNPPEWRVYADEGHGWWLTKNRIDFAERVERFLAQHLK